MLEIIGAALVFALGTSAVALWLALNKLNVRYDALEDAYDVLLEDYQKLCLEEYEAQD